MITKGGEENAKGNDKEDNIDYIQNCFMRPN